jgi:hypothetical protein
MYHYRSFKKRNTVSKDELIEILEDCQKHLFACIKYFHTENDNVIIDILRKKDLEHIEYLRKRVKEVTKC